MYASGTHGVIRVYFRVHLARERGQFNECPNQAKTKDL